MSSGFFLYSRASNPLLHERRQNMSEKDWSYNESLAQSPPNDEPCILTDTKPPLAREKIQTLLDCAGAAVESAKYAFRLAVDEASKESALHKELCQLHA